MSQTMTREKVSNEALYILKSFARTRAWAAATSSLT